MRPVRLNPETIVARLIGEAVPDDLDGLEPEGASDLLGMVDDDDTDPLGDPCGEECREVAIGRELLDLVADKPTPGVADEDSPLEGADAPALDLETLKARVTELANELIELHATKDELFAPGLEGEDEELVDRVASGD